MVPAVAFCFSKLVVMAGAEVVREFNVGASCDGRSTSSTGALPQGQSEASILVGVRATATQLVAV